MRIVAPSGQRSAARSALDVRGGLHGARSGGEGGEEGVALGADLGAAARHDGGAQDLGMPLQDRAIAVAELPEQARGPLDIGEQEGHRTGRECSGPWRSHRPPQIDVPPVWHALASDRRRVRVWDGVVSSTS